MITLCPEIFHGKRKIFFSCEKRTKMAKNKGFLNGKTRSILCRMTIFMKKEKGIVINLYDVV